MRLTGLVVAACGLVLLVAGMWLIGVPRPLIGGVVAAAGLAALVAGVTVDWDDKPAR